MSIALPMPVQHHAVVKPTVAGDGASFDPSCVLRLPVLRCRIDFHAGMPWQGAGAMAWRGTLGHVLAARTCRPGVCDWRQDQHAPGCAYPLFFPSGRAHADGRERAVPFALDVDNLATGVRLELGLFGVATHHANTLLAALADAGKRGVGPRRGVLHARAAWFESPTGSGCWQRGIAAAVPPLPRPPNRPPRIGLQLLSPLRIRRRGRHLTAAGLTPADLLQTLSRRAHALLCQTGSGAGGALPAWPTPDAAIAWQQAHFHWHEHVHHSGRQHARMRLGGVVGQAVLDGAAVAPFWPLLWLGQWLHAGKGCSYGFGHYRLRPLP